jgi:hypothetical protein
MTAAKRPYSVRARGARRLTQVTVGMVVAGVGGVAGLAVHDADAAHTSSETVSQATSTGSATDSTTSKTTDSNSATNDSSGSSSSAVMSTQSTPQATSGGS